MSFLEQLTQVGLGLTSGVERGLGIVNDFQQIQQSADKIQFERAEMQRQQGLQADMQKIAQAYQGSNDHLGMTRDLRDAAMKYGYVDQALKFDDEYQQSVQMESAKSVLSGMRAYDKSPSLAVQQMNRARELNGLPPIELQADGSLMVNGENVPAEEAKSYMADEALSMLPPEWLKVMDESRKTDAQIANWADDNQRGWAQVGIQQQQLQANISEAQNRIAIAQANYQEAVRHNLSGEDLDAKRFELDQAKTEFDALTKQAEDQRKQQQAQDQHAESQITQKKGQLEIANGMVTGVDAETGLPIQNGADPQLVQQLTAEIGDPNAAVGLARGDIEPRISPDGSQVMIGNQVYPMTPMLRGLLYRTGHDVGTDQ